MHRDDLSIMKVWFLLTSVGGSLVTYGGQVLLAVLVVCVAVLVIGATVIVPAVHAWAIKGTCPRDEVKQRWIDWMPPEKWPNYNSAAVHNIVREWVPMHGDNPEYERAYRITQAWFRNEIEVDAWEQRMDHYASTYKIILDHQGQERLQYAVAKEMVAEQERDMAGQIITLQAGERVLTKRDLQARWFENDAVPNAVIPPDPRTDAALMA